MASPRTMVVALVAAMALATSVALGGCKARKPSTETAAALDKGKWGSAVLARMKVLEPTSRLQFDEKAFELTFEDGDRKGVILLGNYWDEARISKLSIDEIAARIHRSRVDAPATDVLPSLRERVTIEVDGHLRARLDPKLGAQKATDTIPYQPIGEVLALGLVEDRPETIQWLSNKALSERKATFDPTLATATRALLARPRPTMRTLRPGAYRFDGDEYASTHFLLGSLERGLSVQGSPVAFFLSRETVLLTGSDDADGLKTLLDEVGREAAKPRAWTPRLLRRAPAGWSLFQDTPILAEVQRRGLLADYERQTTLLRSMAHDGGTRDEDAFTAQAIAVQNKKSGAVFTLATLTQTVDTLLPEVELVDLAVWEDEKARHIGVVRFSALQKTLGARMVKTTLWPTRYRISSFPVAAELRALKPQTDLP